MCLFYYESFIDLKIAQIFNSFDSILSVEICSSIPPLEMYCLLDNPPHKTKKVDTCGTNAVENMEMFGDSLHRCALISPFSTLAKIADAPIVWN
jgi:hypothetical protein